MDTPVAVIAWGRMCKYHPSPVEVCGVSMRDPADFALYFLRNRSPLVLQWHALSQSLSHDSGDIRSESGPRLTGMDKAVQEQVFRRPECAAACHEILQNPGQVIMSVPGTLEQCNYVCACSG